MKKELHFATGRGIVTLRKEGEGEKNKIFFNDEELTTEQAIEGLWRLLEIAEQTISNLEQDNSTELRELGLCADLQATAAAVSTTSYDLSETDIKEILDNTIKRWRQ